MPRTARRAAPAAIQTATQPVALAPQSRIAASHKAADTGRAALRAFDATFTSADSDNLRDRRQLVAYSEALARDESLAGGAVRTTLAHVVGTGLRVHPQINAEFLGITDEEAETWQDLAKFVFDAHADRLDYESRRTWLDLQDLALRTPLVRADALAIRRSAFDPGDILATKVQLIEGDRLTNPNQPLGGFGNLISGLPSGVARRTDGIDFDARGRPVTYHVANRHPFDLMDPAPLAWQPVPAFAADGTPQVLHLWFVERMGESRGKPWFTPVIELFKQMGRYTDAEVMAAVVNAMFAVILKKKRADTPSSLAVDAANQQAAGASAPGEYRLGTGTVLGVGDDEEVTFADPKRPNTSFGPFVESVLEQVAVGLGLSYEVLIGHYTASYSAARASLLQVWKSFWRRREWLTKRFCQPVYEWVIAEAVYTGLLSAPGFFEHPLIRRAWLGTEWIGDPPGAIDEVKEVDGAGKRIHLNLSTETAETAALTGGDWRRDEKRRKRERAAHPDIQPAPAAPEAPKPPENLDSDLETPPAARQAA
jgi:lambda family phage portal protein